jgi:hypothetical protein
VTLAGLPRPKAAFKPSLLAKFPTTSHICPTRYGHRKTEVASVSKFQPSTWASLREERESLHWSLQQENKAIFQAVKMLLDTAEEELRLELEEELHAGDYDGKELQWKQMVHQRAVTLALRQQEILDAAAVQVLQVINEETLYHHGGFDSVEAMFRESGTGASLAKISNLNGLATTAEWVKANEVPCLEPVDMGVTGWRAVDPDEWFRGKNKDGGSRTHRMITVLPELRRITGYIKAQAYGPQLEKEIRAEVEASEVPLDQVENVVRFRVREQLVTIMTNALKQIANHTKTTTEVRELFNEVRNAKPVIPVFSPNGDGLWRIGPFTLNQRQWERFETQNQHSAILKVESPEKWQDAVFEILKCLSLPALPTKEGPFFI